jgi:hypothetical protein
MSLYEMVSAENDDVKLHYFHVYVLPAVVI